MATTNIGVNHPLAQKLWSRKLFQEVTGDLGITNFIGEGTNNIIQTKTESQKNAGDQITFGLRVLMSGDGVQGDNTQEGNEEALSLYNDAVVINQLRHATRTQGKMSEQRVPWSVRAESKDALADWWKERMETSIFNQLAGNSDQTDTRYTGNNTATAPTSGRLIVGGEELAEASLSATTTHAIDLADIDKCVAIAKTTNSTNTRPRMRPVKVNGKDMYVAFLHPFQIRQMRGQVAAGGWYDLHSSMLQGGHYKDNPILTGAEFIYNNTIVYDSSYLPNVASSVTANTSYRRGVFCGAQAAAIGYGQGGSKNKMDWQEEMFDYGNQLGCSAGLIFGVTKTVFNSIDYAAIVLSGYAPDPAS